MTRVETHEEGFESRLVAAPKTKILPSDLLGARRSFMRRFQERHELETPSLKELQKHAEHFGTQFVVETAAEFGYDFDTCLRLQEFCDRVDAAKFLEKHPRARPQKVSSAESRVRALLGIEEEEEKAA